VGLLAMISFPVLTVDAFSFSVPSYLASFCAPIPANWTLRFNPNTTVGYSPSWYEFGEPGNRTTSKCGAGEPQLVNQAGTLGYTSLPISIVKQNGNTVEVKINQVWKDGGISWIATRFVDAAQYKLVCPKKNEVPPGAVDYSTGNVESGGYTYGQTFTAKCVGGVANIEVYVHDGSGPFKVQPEIWVPPDCKPSKDKGNKIGYNFTVPCSPSCPGDSPALPTVSPTLQPSTKPTSKPTSKPTETPTSSPTYAPTKEPTHMPTARPTMAPTEKKAAVDCPVVTLDFEMLTPGQYITSELKATYGVTLKAWASKNAFTPNGAARVLDTANRYGKEDTMHMSPNQGCGGQGVGAGGAPGSPFSNCDPLSKILVVQASSVKDSYVKANTDTSYMSFTFDEPVNLHGVVFAEALGSNTTKAVSNYKVNGLCVMLSGCL
jgi:PT repeat